MKKDFCKIVLVLDRSGSMGSIAGATVEGANTFLSEQKNLPGEASFTLHQFDTVHDQVYAGPIANAPLLTLSENPGKGEHRFEPRNGTALYDAIGFAIDGLGKELGNLPEDQRPDKVVFAIMTDGMNNASQTFKRHEIAAKIKHQTDIYKWQFLFLGANINAEEVGATINIPAAQAMTYTASYVGTRSAMRGMASNVGHYRTSGISGQSIRGFDSLQKSAALEDDQTKLDDLAKKIANVVTKATTTTQP